MTLALRSSTRPWTRRVATRFSCRNSGIVLLILRVRLLKRRLVDRELNGVRLGSSTQVVHPRLESTLPRVEVHRCELARVRRRDMHVERLALAHEGRAVRRE